jgi:hypothetical protein
MIVGGLDVHKHALTAVVEELGRAVSGLNGVSARSADDVWSVGWQSVRSYRVDSPDAPGSDRPGGFGRLQPLAVFKGLTAATAQCDRTGSRLERCVTVAAS